jgi:hypothetical protein
MYSLGSIIFVVKNIKNGYGHHFTGMFISYYFTEVEMFGTDWKFNMATRPAI